MKPPRWLDPDMAWLSLLRYDHWAHMIFGALMVLLIKIPLTGWIFADPVHRSFLLQTVVASFVGFAYEVRDALDFTLHNPGIMAQPDQGFGLVDWAYVTVGALLAATTIKVLGL